MFSLELNIQIFNSGIKYRLCNWLYYLLEFKADERRISHPKRVMILPRNQGSRGLSRQTKYVKRNEKGCPTDVRLISFFWNCPGKDCSLFSQRKPREILVKRNRSLFPVSFLCPVCVLSECARRRNSRPDLERTCLRPWSEHRSDHRASSRGDSPPVETRGHLNDKG